MIYGKMTDLEKEFMRIFFCIQALFDVTRENFAACKLKADIVEICGIMKYVRRFGLV